MTDAETAENDAGAGSQPGGMTDFIGRLDRFGPPLFTQIVTALEDAVARGVLRPGDRLPTQRALATRLGVDLTTVTRAYTEARHRGLIDAVTGRGSFIPAVPGETGPILDLSMLMPPPPKGLSLGSLIGRGVGSMLTRTNADVLMSYHDGHSTVADRLAAARWLEPVLGPLPPSRLMVAPGAQAALAALLSRLARPGDTILTEEHTYPGLLSLARLLGLKVVGIEQDAEGACPETLMRACREFTPRLLYLQPTIHNPTTVTMPLSRRRAIARLVEANRLTLIEDDPYSRLMDQPLPALSSLVPACSYYVGTLAKCLSPGLRTAFVAGPSAGDIASLAGAVRAIAMMPAPLMTSLVTRWIMEGTASHLLGAVRREARDRQELALALLPEGARSNRDGLHIWQELPGHWNVGRLVEQARRQGLGLLPASSFHADGMERNAVRIALGAVADRGRLAEALAALARLISEQDAMASGPDIDFSRPDGA